MNKALAILFSAILLIFTQSKGTAYANFSDDNSDASVKIHSSDKSTQLHELEDENDNEEDGDNRVISIIPGSTPSANIKHAFTGNISLTPTPTTTPEIETSEAQTTDTAVTPTQTQAPSINTQNSQNESASASFDFVKELEKLLSSLKRIIFTTIS